MNYFLCNNNQDIYPVLYYGKVQNGTLENNFTVTGQFNITTYNDIDCIGGRTGSFETIKYIDFTNYSTIYIYITKNSLSGTSLKVDITNKNGEENHLIDIVDSWAKASIKNYNDFYKIKCSAGSATYYDYIIAVFLTKE